MRMQQRSFARITFVLFIVLAAFSMFAPSSFAANTINTSLSMPPNNLGLVGWWTFDGNKMLQNVADSSGGGHTGYLTNFTSTTTAPGKLGQALSFDSVSNYVDLGGTALLTAGSPFSLSWWEKMTTDTNSYPSRFLFKLSGSTNYFLVDHTKNDANYGTLTFGSAPNTSLSIRASSQPTSASGVGVWRHYVITGTNPNSTTPANYALYVNGTSYSLDNGSSYVTYSGNSRIGYDGGGDNGSDATIDDVRVYNRALSAAEVKTLYQTSTGTHIGVSGVAKVKVTAPKVVLPPNAPAYVQYWSASAGDATTNVTSLTITADNTGSGSAYPTSGNKLYAFISMSTTGGSSGLNTPTGWTKEGAERNQDAIYQQLYSYPIASTGSVSVTFNNTLGVIHGYIVEVSGSSGVDTITEAQGSVSATPWPSSTGTGTQTGLNDLGILFAGIEDGVGPNDAVSGYTQIATMGQHADGTIAYGDTTAILYSNSALMTSSVASQDVGWSTWACCTELVLGQQLLLKP